MEINIPYTPEDVTPTDEAYPAFKAGGLSLRFYLIYKSFHLTNQNFRPSLEKLVAYFQEISSGKESDIVPYKDIEEFQAVLRGVGIGCNSQWLIKHWDYFNLNIQRQITLKYSIPKTETI